jgi:predicted nucleic acid-binding protein
MFAANTAPQDHVMILADTSVWIDHFRKANPYLCQLLTAGEIVCHPFVTGELATGMMKNRTAVLGLLRNLLQLPVTEEDDFYSLIQRYGLYGKGIGFVDIHLALAVKKSGFALWTLDKRLLAVARELSIAYPSDVF